MKRFNFRLDSVLNLRRARENALLGELAEARRELAAEKLALQQRRERVSYVIRSARDRRKNGHDVTQDALLQRYLDVLKEEVDLQMERVTRAESKVEDILADVLQAMKDRKALEKLRERRLEEYRKELAQEEVRTLDEIAARIA